MKHLLAVSLLLLAVVNANAQGIKDTALPLPFYNKWTEMMESDPKDRWSRRAPNKDFQLFERYSSILDPNNKLAAITGFYHNASLTWLNGQAFIELAAAGINKDNASQFLYHVVLNDSVEIIPWQHPSEFRTNARGSYAYLGKFEAANKLTTVEIYHKDRYYDKRVLYYNNLYTPRPVIADARLYYNDRHLFDPYKQEEIPLKKMVQIGGYEMSAKGGYIEIQHRSFEWSDSIHHINISMKPTLLNEMYYVYLRYYNSKFSDTTLISNKWNVSYYSKNPELGIDGAHFKRPGNYEIIIAVKLPEEFNHFPYATKASLFFSVQPSSIVQFSVVEAIAYTLFLILIGTAGFLWYRRRNKRILEKKNREKELATLQLRAVRAQLNPHFMFNALSGIQNLVNKQEGAKASDYLSRFARITRHILKEADSDMTSIGDEIALLDDYLQMEQLRFDFKYKIEVGEDIKKAETEIPAMLLQPLVENAVKHGISNLGGQGFVDISIQQKNDSLELCVTDNGKGFSLMNNKEGYGLRLIKERIQLLNQLYSYTNIHFDVYSTEGSCTCKIELNRWL